MANWSNPLITTQYDVFVAEAKERDVDCAQLFYNAGSATNIPLNTIRYNRATSTFQEWLGPVSGWQDKIIGVAGGGTGAASSAGAVAGLGLGTMSLQNSNAVNITGGAVSVSTLYAAASFALSCSIALTADNIADLGTNAIRFRKGYIRDAFVIPVGVDKYAVS